LGCYGGVKKPPDESQTEKSDDTKIAVEAYLFDVKLRRKNKPTSIRLDLYQTDSVVAMYGRGYFNKGAFWGRLTEDSLTVYFPSTKEFLDETVEDLFMSFDCESESGGLNLLSYFMRLPDGGDVSEHLVIKTISEKENFREITVSSVNCPWRILIDYSKEEIGWRIDKFEFDDGKEFTIKGGRRRYKAAASVSSTQFRIKIPPEAFKISL
jgi:hypothetical protein